LLRLPVVVVSAKNSTPAVVKGLRQQCNDWIHKPYDRAELVARVRTQLRLKETLRATGEAVVPRGLLLALIPAAAREPLLKALSAAASGQRPDQLQAALRDSLVEALALPNQAQHASLLDRLCTSDAELAQARRLLAQALVEVSTTKESLQAAKYDLERLRRERREGPAEAAAATSPAPAPGPAIAVEGPQEGHRSQRIGGGDEAGRPPAAAAAPPPEPGPPEAAQLLMHLQWLNSQLWLEVRQRDRSLHVVQDELRSEAAKVQALHVRCADAEAGLRRAQLDNALLAATQGLAMRPEVA